MDTRTINEAYANIASELIQEYPELDSIRKSEVNIVYLSSEHKKTKTGGIVYGECEKVPDKYRWGIPADFTITIFEPNVQGFNDIQMEALIFHELLHVGIDGDKYFIRPHDLQDFKVIIDRYGTDWAEVD